MKWRNQLLALFCLLAFAGVGILYFQHWVIRKPFGIIVFVGEGLSPARLGPTRTYAGGAGTRLNVDSMPQAALVMNYSKDFAAPDQAAAATAIATGERVANRALAINAEGKPIKNIVELAREHGRATGLVTDTKLTESTSAAFYAHPAESTDLEKIAAEFVDRANIDIAMGGGGAQFLPVTKGGERQDNRDLLLELRGNGFDIVRTRAELETIPAWRRPKLFGVFSDGDLAFTNQVEERNHQPSLSDMVRRAIQLLQYNPGGYLLVVDAGLMRKAAQENNGERTLSQTVELDRAVGVARSYGGQRSTIVVCGDVAIGGLSLNGFPFRKDSGIALLGFNSAGQPWITWATGPHGTKSYGPARIPEKDPAETQQSEEPEPAAFYTKSALVTVEDVVAFGSGPGTDALQGVVESTTVFEILRDEL
ncbi:MAG TPA: alkaline phosphatase [Candidatus Udaeobacter sp.]|nr:alkaline phosphatase [Candidatus Udaeobacter sp.]